MTSFGDVNAGSLAFSPASFGGFDGAAAAGGSFSSFAALSSSFMTRLDLPTPLVDFLCQRHVQPGNEDLARSLERHQQQYSLPHHPATASSSASSSNYAQRDHELLHAIQQVYTLLTSSPDDALPHVRSHLLPLLSLPPPAGASAFLHLWKRAYETKGKEKGGFSENYETQIKVQTAIAAARLLRNVVAGEGQLQAVVFQRMGAGLLSLLRLGGSLAFASDPEIQPLTRSLVQLLSNLVTLNKPLQKALFHHLRLKPHLTLSENEAAERVNVVQALLASPDPGTVEAVQVLLLNCIKGSSTNSSGLATSLGGRRLLGQLLTSFEAMAEEEDSGEDEDAAGGSHEEDDDEDEAEDFGVGDLQIEEGVGAVDAHNNASSSSASSTHTSKSSTPTLPRNASHANGHGHAANKSSSKSASATRARREVLAATMRVGYATFAHLFELGLFKHMYRNLSPRRVDGDGDATDEFGKPLVTTEQTLLLKTVDGWINAGGKNHTMNDESTVDQFKRLPYEFARLSQFLRGALQASSATTAVDRRVVGVHQAVVLILEVLVQLGMIGCEGLEEDEQFKGECEELLRVMRSRVGSDATDATSATTEATSGDGAAPPPLDVIHEIVETLRVSNEFAPPVSPFTTAANGSTPLPQGHAATSTGRNHAAAAANSSSSSSSSPPAFRLDNLNRCLVQLLGVLAFQHSPSSLPRSFVEDRTEAERAQEMHLVTSVQDRVRESGGLFTVISLTQVDERNPYIKEHALFTLRYLLQGNLASQELVGRLEQVGGGGGGER